MYDFPSTWKTSQKELRAKGDIFGAKSFFLRGVV
jgi:hypothetical protein